MSIEKIRHGSEISSAKLNEIISAINDLYNKNNSTNNLKQTIEDTLAEIKTRLSTYEDQIGESLDSIPEIKNIYSDIVLARDAVDWVLLDEDITDVNAFIANAIKNNATPDTSSSRLKIIRGTRSQITMTSPEVKDRQLLIAYDEGSPNGTIYMDIGGTRHILSSSNSISVDIEPVIFELLNETGNQIRLKITQGNNDPIITPDLRGPQGPKGDTGPQGVPGPKGEKGEEGKQGLRGTAGKDGATTLIRILYSDEDDYSSYSPTYTGQKYMGFKTYLNTDSENQIKARPTKWVRLTGKTLYPIYDSNTGELSFTENQPKDENENPIPLSFKIQGPQGPTGPAGEVPKIYFRDGNGDPVGLSAIKHDDDGWIYDVSTFIGPRGEKGKDGEKGDKGDPGPMPTINFIANKVESNVQPSIKPIEVPGSAYNYNYTIDIPKGVNGLTPYKSYMNGDNLIICLTSNIDEARKDPDNYPPDYILTIPQVKGNKGDKGDPFKYEDFTEAQLESLKGPQGNPGKDGIDGLSVIDISEKQYLYYPDTTTIAATEYTITCSNGKEERKHTLVIPSGIPGPKGDQGANGNDGKGISKVEQAHGYDLSGNSVLKLKFTYSDDTSDEFTIYDGFKGEKGETGKDGPPGPKGEDGTSFHITGTVSSESALPNPGKLDDVYFVTTTQELHAWVEKDSSWVNLGAVKGAKGDAFKYEDFTEAQLESLKGEQGVGITNIQETTTAQEFKVITISTSDGKNIPVTLYNGKNGKDGAVIYTGNGAPVLLNAHKDGDLYIDTATGDLYKFYQTSWGQPLMNIKGSKGDTGRSLGEISVNLLQPNDTPSTTYTDNGNIRNYTLNIPKAKDGEKGNGIASITSKKVDSETTVTITTTDNTTTTFKINDGISPLKGTDYFDGTKIYTQTTAPSFDITNNGDLLLNPNTGELKICDQSNKKWNSVGTLKGPKGDPFTFNDLTESQKNELKGDPGIGIKSISDPVVNGLTKTYTITLTDDSYYTITTTDGSTPSISSDGYWVINNNKTNVKAIGINGVNGTKIYQGTNTPDNSLGADGDYYLAITSTEKSLYKKDGGSWGNPQCNLNGLTPYIQNNNWYIGSTNTGIKALGTDGTKITFCEGNPNIVATSSTYKENDLIIDSQTYILYRRVKDGSGNGNLWEEKDCLKGHSFTYSDFTPEQLEGLKGEDGSYVKASYTEIAGSSITLTMEQLVYYNLIDINITSISLSLGTVKENTVGEFICEFNINAGNSVPTITLPPNVRYANGWNQSDYETGYKYVLYILNNICYVSYVEV